MKIAVLFPGQGSQYAGMGEDIYANLPSFKAQYQYVSEILGLDFRRICMNEENMLKRTEFAQRAIVALSCLIFDQIKDRLASHEVYLAGHSLGEFSALYGAGVFSLHTCLDLVAYRGEVTASAVKKNPGSMLAVIGGDIAKIEWLCADISSAQGELVQIANYNSPGQIVVSGTVAGITAFQNRKQETDAKRVLMLPVQGAFHTPLLEEAAGKMYAKLLSSIKQEPRIPVVMNHDASVLDLANLERALSRQLTGPVLFEQTISYLASLGIEHYIEIGPGNVLSNLIKRQTNAKLAVSLNNYDDLTNLEVVL